MRTTILINTPTGAEQIEMRSYLYGQLKVWQLLLENGMNGAAESSLMELDPDLHELQEVIDELMQGDEELMDFVNRNLY